MGKIITNLGAGIGVVAHGGKVVFVNQDGTALFQFEPKDAETFASQIFNAAAQCQNKPIPFPNEK